MTLTVLTSRSVNLSPRMLTPLPIDASSAATAPIPIITSKTRPAATRSILEVIFFFSSRRRHTRCYRDWSSDVCSSDLQQRVDRNLDVAELVVPCQYDPNKLGNIEVAIDTLLAQQGITTPFNVKSDTAPDRKSVV